MRRNQILILSFAIYLLLGCKPIKKDIVTSGSFVNIENSKEDLRTTEFISPYKQKIDAEMNVVLGTSEVEMLKERDIPESVLSNFVTDLVLVFGKSIDTTVDCSVLNYGGFRNSLPKGNITTGNIFELMPFDNELVIIEIKGEDITPLFNMIAEKGGMPVSGITMMIEKINGKNFPKNPKVGNILFSKEKTYKMITSDYLAGGGDQMTFWTQGKTTTTGKKLRDAIIDHIRFKTSKGESLHPVLDKRITYFN